MPLPPQVSVPGETDSADAMVVLAKRKPVAKGAQEDRVVPVAADSWGGAGSPPTGVPNKATHATRPQLVGKRSLMGL